MPKRVYLLITAFVLAFVFAGLATAGTAPAAATTPKDIVRTKLEYNKYKKKLIILRRVIPRIEAELAAMERSRLFARKKYEDLTKRLRRLAAETLSLPETEIVRTKLAYKKYKNKLLRLREVRANAENRLARAERSRAVSRKKYLDLKKRLETLRAKEIGVGMPEAYDSLPALEEKLGRNLGIFLTYQGLAEDFDVDLAQWLWQRGTKLQVAWEPHNPSKSPGSQPEYSLAAINRGDHDTEIRRWARQIMAFGHPVYFRPMCEMNSDWVAWGAYTNGNRPEEYIPAWRRVRRIFREVGADNAKFIWSPNRAGDEASAAKIFDLFYPGDDYVDYVGMNGYNWGLMSDTPTWTSSWQSFSTVFGPMYRVATRRTDKPLFISEMATTEVGGSKAVWIEHAFKEIRAYYPRIKAVVWFNYNKETDWRIDNNDANLAAFRRWALN